MTDFIIVKLDDDTEQRLNVACIRAYGITPLSFYEEEKPGRPKTATIILTDGTSIRTKHTVDNIDNLVYGAGSKIIK